MKQLNSYITEKLYMSDGNRPAYSPKTKKELQSIIIDRIQNEGAECDLNDIDVSAITDMSNLFDAYHNKIFINFNGDISKWNVKGVRNMFSMFKGCVEFNGDISKWDVSGVETMGYIFAGCKKFNCDLSKWGVSKVTNMESAFEGCVSFSQDISGWDVTNVENMNNMFNGCANFNIDLSGWNIANAKSFYKIFDGCPATAGWIKR